MTLTIEDRFPPMPEEATEKPKQRRTLRRLDPDLQILADIDELMEGATDDTIAVVLYRMNRKYALPPKMDDKP